MPISAPFALHHLPGTGGPALPAFWSGLRHSCSASDTEGLRIETHGGANERDLKHANAATRAELDPHRVRSGVRLLRGWKMSKTFLDRAGVATARSYMLRQRCLRGSPCLRTQERGRDKTLLDRRRARRCTAMHRPPVWNGFRVSRVGAKVLITPTIQHPSRS